MDELRRLKDEAARAMGRRQWAEALKRYELLASKEPTEGTWSLRAGDAARKLGRTREAVRWYERAAVTYADRGFMVRAIAVGKMILTIDEGNDHILRLLDRAQKERARSRPGHRLNVFGGATQPGEHAAPSPRPSESSPHREAGSEAAAGSVEPKVSPLGGASPPSVPFSTQPDSRPDVPPLRGHIQAPRLQRAESEEPLMESIEIVFDDVDDGVPIQASDIIPADELVEIIEEESLDEEALLAKLPSFPLFQVLPQGAFLEVVSRMEHRVFPAGSVVIRRGERGSSLFAIIEGTTEVFLEDPGDEPLATLGPGDVFGEMSLVLDQPRTATVVAKSDVELFEMSRELFRDVIADHPELGARLSRMIKRRLVEGVMATAPLFQRLDPSMRRDLMVRFELREVDAGVEIVRAGAPSDGLYLVVSGTVEALSGEEKAGELGPGQIFGVASLIDVSKRSPLTFRAGAGVMVLRLPRAAFHEVISFYPPVLEHLAEVLDERKAWWSEESLPVV